MISTSPNLSGRGVPIDFLADIPFSSDKFINGIPDDRNKSKKYTDEMKDQLILFCLMIEIVKKYQIS